MVDFAWLQEGKSNIKSEMLTLPNPKPTTEQTPWTKKDNGLFINIKI